MIGASGSGKAPCCAVSTCLRRPQEAASSFMAATYGQGAQPPRVPRKGGHGFQQFNLFDNMTALENCVIGQVKVLGRKKEESGRQPSAALTASACSSS